MTTLKLLSEQLKSNHSWGQKSFSDALIDKMKKSEHYDWKSYCIFQDGSIKFFTLDKQTIEQIQSLKSELSSKIIKNGKKNFISDYWTKEESEFYFSCNGNGISESAVIESL